jgi:hypothetical protein
MIYAIEGFLQIKKKKKTTFLLLLTAVSIWFIKLYEAVSIKSLAQNPNCSLASIP